MPNILSKEYVNINIISYIIYKIVIYNLKKNYSDDLLTMDRFGITDSDIEYFQNESNKRGENNIYNKTIMDNNYNDGDW